MNREVQRLRSRLDRLDRVLVRRLAERQRLVEEVARAKGDPALVRDPQRVEAVMANVLDAAAAVGLSASIAAPVWRVLVERCAAHEADLLSRCRSGMRRNDTCCGCDFGRPRP